MLRKTDRDLFLDSLPDMIYSVNKEATGCSILIMRYCHSFLTDLLKGRTLQWDNKMKKLFTGM